MSSVERTGFINASPGDVWAVLADFDAIGSWASNVDHSCLLTTQEAGVGTTRRIQVGRSTVVEMVTAWEECAMLSYTIAGLPPVVRSAVNTWRLCAEGPGTRVTLTSDVDAGPRPPQKAIAKVVGRRLAAASAEMIAGLTHRVESSLPTNGDTTNETTRIK